VRRTVAAAVIDLDGTCLDHEHQQLHPRVRDAVRAAAQRVPVIIATGRMYTSALPWAREMHVSEPLVCYEGAVVRGMPEEGEALGAVLFDEPLRAEPARRALAVARRENWHYEVFINEQLLCERDRPEVHRYSKIAGVPFTVVPDLQPRLDRGTPKVVCVVFDLPEAQRCQDVLAAELASTARVTTSRPEFIEIVSPRVSKALACEVVCERLGITLADVVAIGDGPNDVELLDAAGYAVAVSTARADVIAHADATCAPPEQAGVADVLESLGLR
jgi:Cof subfamily protein (haloacid dehalogenase superfamily)